MKKGVRKYIKHLSKTPQMLYIKIVELGHTYIMCVFIDIIPA